MTANLGQLEEQINNLNVLNKTSARALDTFADTSNAISVRARQITRDVKPWEVAQENIAITIEEMSRAARCYHPPPSLPAVLSGTDRSPAAVARCIDYLVYTVDYLSSHPPNDYASEIQAVTERQLRQIVQLSEELVKTAFMRAFHRSKGGSATAVSSAPKDAIIRNPAALEGIELVIQRLGENFNRMGIIQNDVRDLLQTKLTTSIESQFDAAYRDEEIGKTQLSNHASMVHVLKHYQKGGHRLLAISRRTRAYVQEMTGCLQQYVLIPLDDDFAVAEMPGELAAAAFDIVLARAMTAIKFDTSVFKDPTRMFVVSRGQDIGLYSGVRYFRDVIFVGLDLIEELWHWKALATSVPGDNHKLVDHVDDMVEQFIFNVRDLLNGYVSCKGALNSTLLVEYTRSLRRTEWFPSVDCTVHESTTNSLFFHKMLLSTYFGAFKLALFGATVTANSERDAVREVRDYMIRCTLGCVQDLQVIADTAVSMQKDAEEKGHTHIHHTTLSLLTGDGECARLSEQVFVLNNVVFLEDNYKREKCFSQRTIPPPLGPEVEKAAGVAEETVVTEALVLLADEKERDIDDFAYSWQSCFPPLFDNADIRGIDRNREEPLRKSQRMAMKQWHKHVTEALSRKIRHCHSQAVMDGVVRSRLVDVSIRVVAEEFRLVDDVLLGRTWSTRPLKWMPFAVEEWVDQIKRLF